jgi:hypothetical protein
MTLVKKEDPLSLFSIHLTGECEEVDVHHSKNRLFCGTMKVNKSGNIYRILDNTNNTWLGHENYRSRMRQHYYQAKVYKRLSDASHALNLYCRVYGLDVKQFSIVEFVTIVSKVIVHE